MYRKCLPSLVFLVPVLVMACMLPVRKLLDSSLTGVVGSDPTDYEHSRQNYSNNQNVLFDPVNHRTPRTIVTKRKVNGYRYFHECLAAYHRTNKRHDTRPFAVPLRTLFIEDKCSISWTQSRRRKYPYLPSHKALTLTQKMITDLSPEQSFCIPEGNPLRNRTGKLA